ncbi:MAG: DUF2800 domain-containing protein [Planctomycetes bacterium]|nr:DUF2800 domain-containing protein [Planctomycetota bacterium]
MATKFQCELSWSASLAKEFDRCKREYWYNRYASWGWWTEKPRGKKYEYMIHKNLTGLAAFTGTCMHDAIEHWFQLKAEGTVMSGKELYEDAVERFRDGWRVSSDGWQAQPNKMVHLYDHHYEIPISKDRAEKMRELLERSAHYFCEHDDLIPVRAATPESWLSVESMDTYQYIGTKVYAVPDFAYSDGDKVHVWDWKTGTPRQEDHFQLRTYALYACEKWSVDPEDIILHASYLAKGETTLISSSIEELSQTQDVMSSGIREMMDVHYDPDVDDLMMENWPPNGDEQACHWCNFRGVCEKGKE